ncbi:MAG: DUF4345 domain-containing protein [Pyrinomonadaceae bacterium]
MILARFSVALTALVYAAIGFIFIADPVYWASSVDISLPTPTAIIDLRATYGGCMLSIAVFLIYCLKDLEKLRTGLIFQAVSLAGFGLTRSLGIFLNPGTRTIMFYLLAAEVFGVCLAVFCLSRIHKTDNI